jgi:thiol-disulfide isomerase/thioredoxin
MPLSLPILGALLGLALPAHADAAPAAAAPNCALTSLADDAPRELHEFRGRVVWVDFWASWCGSCVELAPFLDRLHGELYGAGLQVLGVNLDEEPADARAFLTRHPVRFLQTADASGACPRAYGIEGLPASVLIDRHGVIRYRHRGFRRGEAAQLRAWAEELLAEDAGGGDAQP